jgi:spiro-SPASM protein
MPMTTAILSLLHEPPAPRNSATRLFRHQPVLAWTLQRLTQSRQVDAITLLCWDDQQEAVSTIAGEFDAHVLVKTPRTPIPSLDRISATQRWSDGWRGGLQATCHFDRGFHAPYIQEALSRTPTTDFILLIDPAAALVDPELIDAIISHATAHPHREFFFTQAAPGLAGAILKPAVLDRLAKANTHPGRLLAYSPDTPGLDPITNDMCVPIAPPLARTTNRFALDSDRQIHRFTAATADLNGQLLASSAQNIEAILAAYPMSDPQPREVVLELTTRRATRPIFSPVAHLNLGRGDMEFESLAPILAQLADIDDLRLTLAGVGDPLLHPRFPEILKLITESKIPAVHIETDLLDLSEAALQAITLARIDILSVHLPATSAATYKHIMGIDGYAQVLENLKRLLGAKLSLPLIVPTFTKCRENLEEMEPWYDHWLRILGTAVITGPTDYAAQIPDHAAADMSPPRRRPCARLQSRMTLHSDGIIPSCEQDVLAKQSMGHALHDGLAKTWQHPLQLLRSNHDSNNLQSHPLCSTCKEWHRP